ncbi:hypothetical protein TNCV_827391 [Trichonephila clavipes]|nr:hypothetical protein TNCV_827391 [Trichonephila clavipes]
MFQWMFPSPRCNAGVFTNVTLQATGGSLVTNLVIFFNHGRVTTPKLVPHFQASTPRQQIQSVSTLLHRGRLVVMRGVEQVKRNKKGTLPTMNRGLFSEGNVPHTPPSKNLLNLIIREGKIINSGLHVQRLGCFLTKSRVQRLWFTFRLVTSLEESIQSK